MEISGHLHALVAFPQGQKSPVPIGPSAGLDAAEKRKLSLPYQNQTSILQSSSL